MLRNYFTVAIRNLIRHRIFSTINITGLSIGFSFSLIAFVFIRYELSYDTFHQNANHLYRIYVKAAPEHYNKSFKFQGTDPQKQAAVPIPFAEELATDFPEIVRFARMKASVGEIERSQISSREAIAFIDRAFFSMFSFQMLQGNSKTALQNRNAIVITPYVATKYFGDENPLGKQLSIKLRDQSHDFTVTGIIEKPPSNSSIQFSILLPFERFPDAVRREEELTDWTSLRTLTFVQLSEHADVTELENKLTHWTPSHFPAPIEIHFQSLSEIHKDTTISSLGTKAPTSPYTLLIVSGIAFCIVLIGCVNFMNLSIGLAASRQREIGIRKVLGASRSQLAKQFWGEAGVLSLFALLISLVFVEWLLPMINSSLRKISLWKELAIGYDPSTFIALFLLVIVISLLAGGYPALVISNLHPILILKGWQKIGSANLLTRILIVFQFSLSISLIICTLFMFFQLEFLQKRDLRFTDDQIIVIRTPDYYKGRAFLELFRNELQPYEAIEGITGTSRSFGYGTGYTSHRLGDKLIKIHNYIVDYDYISFLEIDFLEGRDFSRNFPGDEENAVIVNRKLVDEFGWTSLLGKELWGKTVIGVVEDYHYMSLHHEMEPMALQLGPRLGRILLKINPLEMQHTLSQIESKWKKIAP